jgi:gluconokinase
MSARDLILSVDIGTSATKAVLFDTGLRQVAIARKAYPTHAPHRGWSEQAPEVVLDAVVSAVREMTSSLGERNQLLAVSFSSQLSSIIAVDTDGKALTNSLTWSDTRSAGIAESIKEQPAAQGIPRRTGCPIDAMYPLSKIVWLKENVELPGSVRFVSIKEYAIFRLAGQWVADWSVASATGLCDIARHEWDETALSLLGVTAANFSELVSPRSVVPKWDQDMSDLMGLPPNVQLVVGGGDGPLASIGVGAFDSSTLAINVGTSAAARMIISEPQVDPEGRLWTYAVDEDLWVIGGMVSSGGMVYEWLLRNLFSGTEETEGDGLTRDVHECADRLASAVPPGAEDLILVPYLGGEQSPSWRPHTRGSFFGLDVVHGRGHLVRAVLEGITRSIYRVSESIKTLQNGRFSEARVTGRLALSATWLQIAADMLGIPMLVPESVEGSARGAAVLAMLALGLKSGIEDFSDMIATRQRVETRAEMHAYYERQYLRFEELLDYTRRFHGDKEM